MDVLHHEELPAVPDILAYSARRAWYALRWGSSLLLAETRCHVDVDLRLLLIVELVHKLLVSTASNLELLEKLSCIGHHRDSRLAPGQSGSCVGARMGRRDC